MTARLLPLTAVAARLGGVSLSTVRDLIRTGRLGHARVQRRLLVPESELDAYIQRITVPARTTRSRQTAVGISRPPTPPESSSGVQRLIDIRTLYAEQVERSNQIRAGERNGERSV